MLKYLVFLLLPCSCLLPAKIGITCLKNQEASTCILRSTKVIEKLQSLGHTAEMVPINPRSRMNLEEYDVLVHILPYGLSTAQAQKTILYLFEPPVIVPSFHNSRFLRKYHKVFTWNHDIVDNTKYFKGFYTDLSEMHEAFIPFKERKFACLINSYLRKRHIEELYSTRVAVAKFYEEHFPEVLNVYGSRGWEQFDLSVWKGRCEDKHEILRNHKFCFSYENWDNPCHYISEKMLHCLQNRCVPIYLGSSRVTDYIPEDAFIDARKFSSIAEMHEFISTMTEETWLTYIKAIEEFMTSEKSRYFKEEYYVNELCKEILKSLEEFGAI